MRASCRLRTLVSTAGPGANSVLTTGPMSLDPGKTGPAWDAAPLGSSSEGERETRMEPSPPRQPRRKVPVADFRQLSPSNAFLLVLPPYEVARLRSGVFGGLDRSLGLNSRAISPLHDVQQASSRGDAFIQQQRCRSEQRPTFVC